MEKSHLHRKHLYAIVAAIDYEYNMLNDSNCDSNSIIDNLQREERVLFVKNKAS